MSITRRNALKLAAATSVSVLGSASSQAKDNTAPAAHNELIGQTSSIGPLFNKKRALSEMNRLGVDAIIAATPNNIYYMTNYLPQLSRMGFYQTDYAIFVRDDAAKPILITSHVIYYLTGSEDVNVEHTDLRLFTGPLDVEAYNSMSADKYAQDVAARPFFTPKIHDDNPVTDRRLDRIAALKAAAKGERHASAQNSLVAAIKEFGLEGKRIAIDDLQLKNLLEQAEVNADYFDGDHVLRSIRLQRSPAELALHKYAIRANAEAGIAAARSVRQGATLQEMRTAFSIECAKRGNTSVFMVIDGVSSPQANGELKDGHAFMIDCVSSHHGYLGDYGRTIFVGEPTRKMASTTKAMSDVWDEILGMLKPGVRYSQIREVAANATRKSGIDVGIGVTPHVVGMNHTDEPGKPNQPTFLKQDLALVEGMVLSVDVPVMDLGLGGSAHLEDLVLITKDGPEFLNDANNRVILV